MQLQLCCKGLPLGHTALSHLAQDAGGAVGAVPGAFRHFLQRWLQAAAAVLRGGEYCFIS